MCSLIPAWGFAPKSLIKQAENDGKRIEQCEKCVQLIYLQTRLILLNRIKREGGEREERASSVTVSKEKESTMKNNIMKQPWGMKSRVQTGTLISRKTGKIPVSVVKRNNNQALLILLYIFLYKTDHISGLGLISQMGFCVFFVIKHPAKQKTTRVTQNGDLTPSTNLQTKKSSAPEQPQQPQQAEVMRSLTTTPDFSSAVMLRKKKQLTKKRNSFDSDCKV